MGRTYRASTSPYARTRVNRRKKESPTSKARERQIPHSSGVANRDDVRSLQVPQDATNIPSQDAQGLDHAALASSVAQQIVPELRDYISQSISALGRSPGVVATPDTDTGTNQIAINQQSNILDEQSNNVISNIELNENHLPVTSVCDNIGLHVSKQIKEKIVKGEYVELENLLPVSLSDSNMQYTRSRHIVMGRDGQLELQSKNVKKINDISTWLDAFIAYCSIYLTAHSNCAQSLLKHMFNVKLASSMSKGLGWKSYDQQFRMKKSQNPSMSWGNVDMELWVLCMSHSQLSFNDTQTPVTQYGKCYDFNNKGRCTRMSCRYLHRCIQCSGLHSAVVCIAPRPPQPANFIAGNRNGQLYNNQRGGFRPQGLGQGFRFPNPAPNRQSGPVNAARQNAR